jgi:hypothetical protein
MEREREQEREGKGDKILKTLKHKYKVVATAKILMSCQNRLRLGLRGLLIRWPCKRRRQDSRKLFVEVEMP